MAVVNASLPIHRSCWIFDKPDEGRLERIYLWPSDSLKRFSALSEQLS